MPDKIYYFNDIKETKEFQKLMSPAMLKCIERYQIDELLLEVRAGEESHIQNLVDSFEPIILMTIKDLIYLT